jgi:hypothetical protein
MNLPSIYILKGLRKIYSKIFSIKPLPSPACEQDPDRASQIIYDALMDDKPCMIARYGANELNTLVNYMAVKQQDRSVVKFIKGELFEWWWNKNIINQMYECAGFFPPTVNKVEQFCELMLEDMKEVDVLGSWLEQESMFYNNETKIKKVSLILLEPYIASNPWSRCLKGKRVLVVHPFAPLIEEQYLNRRNLFKNKDVLPDFDLQTITAVQSLGGQDNGFNDWFEALQWMKDEIDKRKYDICLIGCGAYGFHLAAHVKRSGKKAFHLGGALQLFFGIKGNRWESNNYALKWNLPKDTYTSMFNEFWVRPENYRPSAAKNVEGACYW